jgi:small-conductance mechanosensitive channel
MERGRQYSFIILMRYFIWVIAIAIMMHSLGIKLTFLIASSAALLVGIGLGLQRVFSDFTSGIFMLFDGTIEQGDILQIGDTVGVIEKINLRTTLLRDRNDVNIIIPNHKFTEDNVINLRHNTSVTRFLVKVGVSYGSDMEKVKEVLLECASKNPHVVTRDKLYRTTVRMADFGDSSVVFELMFYSDNMFRIESTKSDLRFAIWHAFKENGIQIPFPQRDLHIRSADGLQLKQKEE